MEEALATTVVGALAIQSGLIIWMLNKLTKHCEITRGDSDDLKVIKQMHGMEQPPLTHPPIRQEIR